VCALVECTEQNGHTRQFSLPASGFEDGVPNPCRSPASTGLTSLNTIDIVGLSIERIPAATDGLSRNECTLYNRCSVDPDQRCSRDQDCNPVGTCSKTLLDCNANPNGEESCLDENCCPGKDETCVFPDPCLLAKPYGPMVDLLGTVYEDPDDPNRQLGVPLRWTDDTGISKQVPIAMQDGSIRFVGVSEYPALGETQDWEIYNFTPDAHPIHIHLVQFNVLSRALIPGCQDGDNVPVKCGDSIILGPHKKGHKKGRPLPQEEGWKDTVIAYPGQVTTVRAKFDIEGLYVWHCHILEHEDNEMMRPYAVKGPDDDEDSDTDSDSRGDDDSDTDSDSRGDDDSEDSDRA
jgi:hypothetical protein